MHPRQMRDTSRPVRPSFTYSMRPFYPPLLTGDRFATTIGTRLARRDAGERPEERLMADSVYKVIELVGTSTDSWERAAAAALDQASASLRDLRVAEVKQLDVALDDSGARTFRAKLSVSFKYEGGS